MFSLPDHPQRVAFYCRVSTEDQAEQQTIRAQTDYLPRYAELNGLTVAGLYCDDGVSGTLPLRERPEGRRLLQDASAHLFDAVVFTRTDRLARSLKVLLDAYQQIDALGVSLRSASEPFDTSTPIGTFLFQLLGSMAELDRSSTLEKLNRGRDRVARDGKRPGVGPVPFGYDVDAERRLIPSARIDPVTGQAEADIARGIIERIAAGGTIGAEVERLNALGIRSVRRWPPGRKSPAGRELVSKTPWSRQQVRYIIDNPTYRGQSVILSRFGSIETEVPALVSVETWEAAQRQIPLNRNYSRSAEYHNYLLRGLIRCRDCGQVYIGGHVPSSRGAPEGYFYYVCGGMKRMEGCAAKRLPAPWIEAEVWNGCREFVLNPGPALADAQAELRRRLADTATHDARRRDVLRQIAGKTQEQDRVMLMFRRGRITLEDAEAQMDDIARERDMLRAEVESIESQSALADAFEAQITSVSTMLASLRDEVERIERENDTAKKREIIDLLVAGVDVRTAGTGKRKTAEVTIRHRFTAPDDLTLSGNGLALDGRKIHLSCDEALTFERVLTL